MPLSNKEIGFLPGDANDKIGPYMEPLWDNLKFIKSQYGENEKKHKAIAEMEENKKILLHNKKMRSMKWKKKCYVLE